MSPLLIALLALALPLANDDVPELEPFDDAAFDSVFDRLRGRKARESDHARRPATPAPIRFVGALIKRLPARRPSDSESSEA